MASELTIAELAIANAEKIAMLETSLDAGWTILAGVLVFFMQAGFTLLEAGNVRTKNTVNILMKNIIDTSVGAIGWFLIGYGLAFGKTQDGYLGTDSFFMMHDDLKTKEDGSFLYAFWFFQFTFCATAATIVSGALAERCRLEGYCIFSLLMSVFIYPIVVHWTWGGGWLSEEGYTDFAGSGVVHMTGGIAALVGAFVLQPRIDRFNPEVIAKAEFRPTSVLNVCFGTFILWFGWYGFNAGSTTALSGSNAEVAGHCAVTTTLSAACGGIISFALFSLKAKKFDVAAFANGILGGLVGITAGCNNVDTWAACAIGVISGLILFATVLFLDWISMKGYPLFAGLKLQFDDPLSAFAVHGACGMWGVLAVGFFDMDKGLFYDGKFEDIMLPNILGIVAITMWVVVTTAPLFAVLRALKIFRVSEELEEAGLDSECVPKSGATTPIATVVKRELSEKEVIEKLDGEPIASRTVSTKSEGADAGPPQMTSEAV